MSGRANGRKSIFITGAASGIGRATAVLFAGRGWFVGAFDVNEQGLATLRQEIGGDGCITGRLDVTSKENFEAAVALFGAETDGHMDVLFNNAGIGESGWFEDVPYESALRVVQAIGGPRRTGVATIEVPERDGRLDPHAIVAALAERGLRRLLVEGGGRTVSAFLAAGALDRLHLCVAPLIIGSGPLGLALPPIDRLDDALRPTVTVHRLDEDVLFDCALR